MEKVNVDWAATPLYFDRTTRYLYNVNSAVPSERHEVPGGAFSTITLRDGSKWRINRDAQSGGNKKFTQFAGPTGNMGNEELEEHLRRNPALARQLEQSRRSALALTAKNRKEDARAAADQAERALRLEARLKSLGLGATILAKNPSTVDEVGSQDLRLQVVHNGNQPVMVADAPPIRTIGINVSCGENSQYASNDEPMVREVFRLALVRAIEEYNSALQAAARGEVLYVQVRLIANATNQLSYDLTTSMLPVTQMVEEFIAVWQNAFTSETGGEINLDPSDAPLSYEFTFVRPTNNRVTLGLVHATNTLFRSGVEYIGQGGTVRPGRSLIPSLLANRRFLARQANNFQTISLAKRRSLGVKHQRNSTYFSAKDTKYTMAQLQQLMPNILEARRRLQDRQEEARAAIRRGEFPAAGSKRKRKSNRGLATVNTLSPARQVAYHKMIAGFNAANAGRPRKGEPGYVKPKRATAAEIVARTTAKNVKRQLKELRRHTRIAKMAKSKKKHGIYEDLKKRIFHHGCIGDFYNYSKAALCVPTIPEEGYCLAMAFIHAQAITYNMETGEAVESKVVPHSFRSAVDFTSDFESLSFEEQSCVKRMDSTMEANGHLIIPNLDERRSARLLECFESAPAAYSCNGGYSFFGVDTGGHVAIVLFNPLKHYFTPNQLAQQPENTLKYAKQIPVSEIQAWYYAAQTFHQYVVDVTREQMPELEPDFFDPNKEEILQYYSNVTQCVIAIYRVESQGKRTRVYLPENFAPDLRKQKTIRVVSLLFSDVHADSITNLREFLKSKASANRCGINNYCLVCESLSSANNQTSLQGKVHFLKCLEKEGGVLKSSCERLHAKRQISNVTPLQFFKRKKDWYCRTCMNVLEGGARGQADHVCQIHLPDKLKEGEEEDLYVYDFECAQVPIGNNQFKHHVNLVCVRSAYPHKVTGEIHRALFYTLEEFIVYVTSFKNENRIYLAHNGGRYDVQFIMHHLEKNLIPHSFVPAPSSMHAYLSVTIPFGAGFSSVFLDFRNFMPGSLKGIAQSFGLSLSKGDFPHRFNNGSNDLFVGALPELHSPDDYWCLESKRSEQEVEEFITFHQEQQQLFCTCEGFCVCDKRKWDFREQITLYCWLDVDVLAEAVSRYRDNALSFGMEVDICGWKSKGIDPFQYLTIPQLAINLLLGGLPAGTNLTITPIKERTERVPQAIAWMERFKTSIQHAGNTNREYFSLAANRFLDGFDATTCRVYVCLHCHFHACPECYFEEIQEATSHPSRGNYTFSAVNKDTRDFLETLFRYYGGANVEVVWQHELTDLTPYETTLGELMDDREMFFGGRTEVFSPYLDIRHVPEDEIKYHDVCSLYPFVCAFKMLPTGNPIHVCGRAVERARVVDLTHPNRYFGFVRCTVAPRTSCLLGLLPCRDEVSGRLEFPLARMTGSWGTQELELAIRQGYVVEEIFEVYHWTQDERSDTLLRGYIAFFMQMKQEAEGWKKLGGSSEDPSEEEKDILVERTYLQSGELVRIRKELVKKNPVKRQMSKLFLNSLWGKFCQKKQVDSFTTIHSYQQFAELWFDARNDQKGFAFRFIGGTTWKVRVRRKVEFTTSNRRYNIFLAAKVTEWARCILHERMLLIGSKRVLYCDTDSIMFYYPKLYPKLDGVGLGNWIDEYPDDTITKLFAIAPKFYYLEMENNGHSLLKSKGIQMTHGNKRLITTARIGKQLLEMVYPTTNHFGEIEDFKGFVEVKNMLMGVNSTNFAVGYGEMLTRYTADKKIRPVISKRQLVIHSIDSGVDINDLANLAKLFRIYTIPHGYAKSVEEVSGLVYEHPFYDI